MYSGKPQDNFRANYNLNEIIKEYNNNDIIKALNKYLVLKGNLKQFLSKKIPKIIAEDDDIIEFELIKINEYYRRVRNINKDKYRFKIRNSNANILYNEKQYRIGANFYMWNQLYKEAGGDIDFSPYLKSYKALAAISDFVKKVGPACLSQRTHWTLISGINTLYGRIPIVMSDEKLKERVKNWVNNKIEHNYAGSITDYDNIFIEETDKFLMWKKTNINTDETIDRYLNNIIHTSTTGSGYDPDKPKSNFDVTYNDENIRYKKTKFTVSAGLTKEQKIKKMLSEVPSKAKVSIKKEIFPKVRMIVSSDYKTFLKMNYVRRWLYKWLKDEPSSTLWMSDTDKINMYHNLHDFAKQVAIPVDQSAFDHHYQMRFLGYQMNSISKLILKVEENKAVAADLVATINACIKSVDGTIIVLPDGTKFNWTSGLLSGWGLTAELNTLKNIAEKNVALRLLNEKFNIKLELKYFNAQGDDQMVRTNNIIDACLYYNALTSLGPQIQLTKNFFSYEHDEYLRITGQKGYINGYLPRVIDSLMWEPTLTKQSDNQKIAESFAIWRRISMRMYASFNKVKNLFKKDLIHNKIPENIIDDFLSAPKSAGGAGIMVGEGEYNVYNVKDSEIQGKLIFTGAGLKQFEDMFLRNQERGIKNWLVNQVQIDYTGVKESEQVYFVKKEKFEKKRFLIAKNTKIKKPKFSEGWDQSLFININDRVMAEAFPDITTVLVKYHAGKKFIYDWLAGTIKIATPLVENVNDAIVANISRMYENSLIYAMLKKRNKKNKNPWASLNLYYEINFKNFLYNNIDKEVYYGM